MNNVTQNPTVPQIDPEAVLLDQAATGDEILSALSVVTEQKRELLDSITAKSAAARAITSRKLRMYEIEKVKNLERALVPISKQETALLERIDTMRIAAKLIRATDEGQDLQWVGRHDASLSKAIGKIPSSVPSNSDIEKMTEKDKEHAQELRDLLTAVQSALSGGGDATEQALTLLKACDPILFARTTGIDSARAKFVAMLLEAVKKMAP